MRTRTISVGPLGIVVCAVIFGGVATRSLRGQGQPSVAMAAATPALSMNDDFQQTVLPVLAKNCMGCHSDRLHSGNLSLEQFREPATALGKPDVWQKVLDKLTAGQMPPRPAAPLGGADLAAVTGWIKKLPGVSETAASNAPINPGRVTARRLNRTEYNNTIRDLLGVAARPADEFPVDDSGYGFDNNSDVLSVSPLLMEKYMQAAKTISHLAVYGETLPPKPGLIVRLLNRRSQDNYDVLGGGNQGIWLPYSLRGAMYGRYTFPVDGEYEFRLRIANFRGAEEVNPDLPAGGGAGALARPQQPADAVVDAGAAPDAVRVKVGVKVRVKVRCQGKPPTPAPPADRARVHRLPVELRLAHLRRADKVRAADAAPVSLDPIPRRKSSRRATKRPASPLRRAS